MFDFSHNLHPEIKRVLNREYNVNFSFTDNRLSGAVVRAGTESDIFSNAACGVPVTSDQASILWGHIQIVCDPPVIARYVSVDDDDHMYGQDNGHNVLNLCEVIVDEYPMEACLQMTSKT